MHEEPGPRRGLERAPEPEERPEREREEDLVARREPHEREADPPAAEQPLPRLGRVEPAQRLAGAGAGGLVQPAVAFEREGERAAVRGSSVWSAASSALVVKGSRAKSSSGADVGRADAGELASVELVGGQDRVEQLAHPAELSLAKLWEWRIGSDHKAGRKVGGQYPVAAAAGHLDNTGRTP